MKIGIPIVAEFETLGEHIAFCREIGADFIELNMAWPMCFPDQIDWKMLQKTRDIFFTLHLPEDLQMGELFEPARKRNVDYAIQLMREFKDKGGVTTFTLHMKKSSKMTMPHGKVFLFDKYRERYLASLRKSFTELSAFAKQNGVTVCFENVGAMPSQVAGFAELINSPGIYLTLDVGHNEEEGNVLAPVFMRSGKVQHMHLHDVRDGKPHEQVGVGTVDVPRFVDFARKNNLSVLLEVRGRDEVTKSVAFVRGCVIE